MIVAKRYYLSLATIIIRFDVPTNLYLFDDWQKLFDETLFAFRTETKKQDFIVEIIGTTLDGFRVDQEKINSPVLQPSQKGRTLYFDNLLHPRYLLMKVADLIRSELARKGLFMFHASGVAINKSEAIIFTGPSGCGKSTCLKKLSTKLPPLGDDILIIGLKGDEVICYPYPVNFKTDYKRTKNIAHKVLKVTSPKIGPLSIKKNLSTSNSISSILNQFILVPSRADTLGILRISNELSNIHYSLSHYLNDKILPLLVTVGRSTISARRTGPSKES